MSERIIDLPFPSHRNTSKCAFSAAGRLPPVDSWQSSANPGQRLTFLVSDPVAGDPVASDTDTGFGESLTSRRTVLSDPVTYLHLPFAANVNSRGDLVDARLKTTRGRRQA
jgi:hypothetical protein